MFNHFECFALGVDTFVVPFLQCLKAQHFVITACRFGKDFQTDDFIICLQTVHACAREADTALALVAKLYLLAEENGGFRIIQLAFLAGAE